MKIRTRYTYIPKLREYARTTGENSFLSNLDKEIQQLRKDNKKLREALAQHEPDGADPNEEGDGLL